MANLSDFLGGGGAKPWVSGMTVAQWQDVISPADGETYRRKTATGGGTTDPADDVTNYIAVSYTRCLAMFAKSSNFGGNGSVAANHTAWAYGIPRVSPGNVTTGSRRLIHSQTGRGKLLFLGAYKASGAGTVRFEVIIDGRTVLDVSRTTSLLYQCLTLLGNTANGVVEGNVNASIEGYGYPDPSGPEFRRSLELYVTPTAGVFDSRDFFGFATRSEA